MDNTALPEDLSRHLFLSFIKKPSYLLPNDHTAAIGALPAGTGVLPAAGATSSTTITSTATTPLTTHTGPLSASGFSFLPEKFFRTKKNVEDLTSDAKVRSGICSSGKESLIRRGNSHDQHESPTNSRQSSRKSNHSVPSLHSHGKTIRRQPTVFLLIRTSFLSRDDSEQFRRSLGGSSFPFATIKQNFGKRFESNG